MESKQRSLRPASEERRIDQTSRAEIDYNEGNPVQALLRLPQRSLEARIDRLEGEMQTRQKLNDATLTSLGSKQVQLEDRLSRLRYTSTSDPTRKESEAQLLRIKEQERTETLDFYGERSRLTEQLEKAEQELEEQRQRLRLVDAEAGRQTS